MFAGPPVPIWVMRLGHCRVSGFVQQQGAHSLYNIILLRAHQSGGACPYRFRPFGGVAHDQYRLAQSRGFFLNAAGVGQDKMRAHHEIDKGKVILRFNEMYIAESLQDAVDRLLYLRIGMHGIHEIDIWKFL